MLTFCLLILLQNRAAAWHLTRLFCFLLLNFCFLLFAFWFHIELIIIIVFA